MKRVVSGALAILCGSTAADLALGLGALILKDLFAAAQPLIIGACDRLPDARIRAVEGACSSPLCSRCSRPSKASSSTGCASSSSASRAISNTTFATICFATWYALSPDFYARTRTGDIMARATNDLNAVRMMLGPGSHVLVRDRLTLVLAIAIMAWVDWRAGVCRARCLRRSSALS